MPDQNTDADAALTKLGQRLRSGWAKKHPVSDKSLESVRDIVREQWEQEQKVKGEKPIVPPAKDKSPKPPGPDMEP